MKTVFTIFLFFVSQIITAQSPKSFDYTVILGGCFNHDQVSMKVNNRMVSKNYMIDHKDTVTRGNFNFIQDQQGIRINYNGKEESRKAIDFDFILDIKLTVNKKLQRFSIDLRKGNIILFDYCNGVDMQTSIRKITAEQLQEPFLLM